MKNVAWWLSVFAATALLNTGCGDDGSAEHADPVDPVVPGDPVVPPTLTPQEQLAAQWARVPSIYDELCRFFGECQGNTPDFECERFGQSDFDEMIAEELGPYLPLPIEAEVPLLTAVIDALECYGTLTWTCEDAHPVCEMFMRRVERAFATEADDSLDRLRAPIYARIDADVAACVGICVDTALRPAAACGIAPEDIPAAWRAKEECDASCRASAEAALEEGPTPTTQSACYVLRTELDACLQRDTAKCIPGNSGACENIYDELTTQCGLF